jgi:hypothetical protein
LTKDERWADQGRLDHGGAPDINGARHVRDQTNGWRMIRRLVNRDVRHPACSKAPRAPPAIKHAAGEKNACMQKAALVRLTESGDQTRPLTLERLGKRNAVFGKPLCWPSTPNPWQHAVPASLGWQGAPPPPCTSNLPVKHPLPVKSGVSREAAGSCGGCAGALGLQAAPTGERCAHLSR